MDRVHESLPDGEGVVQHLYDRREAIRRAGSVRNDVVLSRIIGVVIHAQHQRHIFFLGRGRNDNLLGSRRQVLCGGVAIGADPRRFDDYIDIQLSPGQCGPLPLRERLETPPVNSKSVIASIDLTVEASVIAVVLEQMRIGLRACEIVHRNRLYVRRPLQNRPQGQPPYAAKAVDCHSCHRVSCSPLLTLKFVPYTTDVARYSCQETFSTLDSARFWSRFIMLLSLYTCITAAASFAASC